MTLRKAVQSDSKVKKLARINDSIKSKINVTELIDEMKNMLLTRKYRSFDKRILEYASNNITDWAGEVSTHQARLADIRVLVIDSKMHLEELIKAAQKHLTSAYKDELKSAKTVNARKAEIDSVLDDQINTLSRLERVIKISEVVDKELERSYYSSVLVKNVLEITTRPDRS